MLFPVKSEVVFNALRERQEEAVKCIYEGQDKFCGDKTR